MTSQVGLRMGTDYIKKWQNYYELVSDKECHGV